MNIQIATIVPVYNGGSNLLKCVDSLRNQSLPKEEYDIIIVDNNSQEDLTLLEDHNVQIVREGRQGSYSARNKGIISHAAEIYAFTDADCTPALDWLENAVRVFGENPDIDLIAGRIQFLDSSKSAYHQWDALYHMNNEDYVNRKRSAVTANLLVRKRVFDTVGFFQEWQSCADTQFSRTAVDHGFNLVYREDVVIHHPARGKKALLAKRFRIGRGMYEKLKLRRWGRLKICVKLLALFTPLYPLYYSWVVTQRFRDGNKMSFFVKMLPVAIGVSLATGRGLWGKFWGSRISSTKKNQTHEEGPIKEITAI